MLNVYNEDSSLGEALEEAVRTLVYQVANEVISDLAPLKVEEAFLNLDLAGEVSKEVTRQVTMLTTGKQLDMSDITSYPGVLVVEVRA